MKRKILLGCTGTLVLIVVGIFAMRAYWAHEDELALKEQLWLARGDGLPTNGAELAATITPAADGENAAAFYRKMGEGHEPGSMDSLDLEYKIRDANAALFRQPSAKNLADARKLLQANRTLLDLVDQASKRPRCWFNRDWSQGSAFPSTEFTNMRVAGQLLALRALVASIQGDVAGSIASARQILTVSKHAEEDGLAFSMFFGGLIHTVGLHELAASCFLHPSIGAYRDELKKWLALEPKPDLVRENRDHLWEVLSMIELSSTEEGRKKLNAGSSSLPPGLSIFSIFFSPSKSKIEVVKAERQFWAALKLPDDQMPGKISEAVLKEHIALFAFPLVLRILTQESSDTGPADIVLTRIEDWRARRLAYEAVLRAVANGTIARSIRTEGLADANEDNPVEYTFDGEQMVISVTRSKTSYAYKLKLPSDPPKE